MWHPAAVLNTMLLLVLNASKSFKHLQILYMTMCFVDEILLFVTRY